MKKAKMLTILVFGLVACLVKVCEAVPMGTAWTYQGRLMYANSAADGEYDFTFKLFDDPCIGIQLGSTIDFNDLDVIDGYFTVELDFGSYVFNGDARWLETTVADANGSDPCTLWPRIEIIPVPYALQTRGIFVDDAGNVGIGTTVPQDTLHVNGGLTVSDNTLIKTASGAHFLRRDDNSGWYVAPFGTDTISNVVIVGGGPGDGQTVGFWTLSKTLLATENSNVGIGTANPTAKLHIGGTPGVDGLKFPDGTLQTTAVSGGDSDWTISGNDMYSAVSGNVGIGTTIPSEKLEVAGTVLVRTPHDATGPGLKVLRRWAPPAIGERYTEVDGVSINAYFRSLTTSGADLELNCDSDGDVLLAQGGGNVGIGTMSPAAKLDVVGKIRISNSAGDPVVEMGEGLDYAEGFDVSESSKIDAGSVLIIDAKNPGKLALSNRAYDSKVAGIVAGAKGLGSAVRLGAGRFDYDVALAGRVYCNVDATEMAIEPGDLLTTAATPGYAMKAIDYMRAQGAILGKAMEKLEKGKKAQILVLVTLQ